MDWSDIVFNDRHLPQSQSLVEKEMLFESSLLIKKDEIEGDVNCKSREEL